MEVELLTWCLLMVGSVDHIRSFVRVLEVLCLPVGKREGSRSVPSPVMLRSLCIMQLLSLSGNLWAPFLSLIPWYTWANAQERVRRANRSGRAWSFCPPDLEAGASSWQQHLAVAAEERALGDLFSCGCERGCCAFWGEMGWLGRRKIRFGSNTVTAEQEPIPCLVFVEPWSLWWPLVLW